ncbi:type II secretion system protein GspL [Pseudaeromonas sp. ZJS20]|uniref:type II secretion system protein GspL n=1 Tax=Pseudaeromonas aegiceratis TaxID=3153928 RepID=UPI00390C5479
MSEIVVIRLGSQVRDPIPWLVWDPAGDEVIASGVLPGAAHLNQLHQRAGGRPLHVLVSAADLAFRQVTVPGRLTRQSLKALPYLLEEELGSDVESLHLVLLGQQGQQVDLVAVEQGRMAMWLDWLEEAGLQPRSLLPDVLCLPWQAERWSALPLAGQWLFRNGPCTGMVVEPAWLDPLLVRIEPAPTIACYGPVPEGAPGEWQAEPPVLAMQLLAAGVLGNSANLLTGTHRRQPEWTRLWQPWRKVAIAAGVCLLAVLANLGSERWQLAQQEQALKAQIDGVYRQLFPEDKRLINPRSQLKQHLAVLEGVAGQQGLLQMLQQLHPVLAKLPDLRPQTLRYDGKQQELRMQMSAAGYDSFDRFRSLVADNFDVKPSEMRSEGNRVTGTLILRNKS